MGRGAQAQTQAMIDQQLAQQNAMNQQLYSSSQALGSQAAAGYQNLIANPGYTDAEKSAITNLSQSALSSSFDALAQNASTRAARTRNSAGYGELIDSLARTQGQQSANLSQQDQIAFANAARSDTLSGLSGLSGLYGTDSSLLGRTLGIPAQLLGTQMQNARNNSSTRSAPAWAARSAACLPSWACSDKFPCATSRTGFSLSGFGFGGEMQHQPQRG